MKLAVSNTALPPRKHMALLPYLSQMGFSGLEVAPAWVWENAMRDSGAASVAAYRHAAEKAGLTIIGLHSLLLAQPGLGIFHDPETVKRTEDFLVHLSAICRDLGGRTLILGSGRQRCGLPVKQAWIQCRDFLQRLLPRIESHGTVLCFDPLGPTETDFCNTATECRILANAMDHPSFGLQLNSCGLTENKESGHAIFSSIYGRLEHFTINEPGCVPLGDSGRVDHAAMRRHLSASGYKGWVSIEQRASADPLSELSRSARFLVDHYLRKDNLSLYLQQLRRQAKPQQLSTINSMIH
jgi:sugar phosphate isomerase/epimerase